MLVKGFLVDRAGRVGDGTRASSPESESIAKLPRSRGTSQRPSPAAAKMLLWLVAGALVAAFRRGESDRDEIVMGEGDAISMSIGVPGAPAANIVCALAKGVLAFFFVNWPEVSGESIDKSVMSVVEGKSSSALPPPIDE